jgi:hypothetical protein
MPVTTYRSIKSASEAPNTDGSTAYSAGAHVLLSAPGWTVSYNITLNSFQLRQGRIEFQVSDALPAAELQAMPWFTVA